MTRFFFLCKKLKWQHSKSYQSDFFGSFNYPRIILRTWKRMNFFLLHQTGSCSENNNISLQGKLQKPPLTLDCYVTSFPQILALSRATRVSMKLLLSKYVYYDAFVPEILTFWIFLDFPQPINPSFFEKKLSPSLQHRYIACILWPGLNTLGSGRCSPCNRIRSETAGRNTPALYCETCKRQTKRYRQMELFNWGLTSIVDWKTGVTWKYWRNWTAAGLQHQKHEYWTRCVKSTDTQSTVDQSFTCHFGFCFLRIFYWL